MKETKALPNLRSALVKKNPVTSQVSADNLFSPSGANGQAVWLGRDRGAVLVQTPVESHKVSTLHTIPAFSPTWFDLFSFSAQSPDVTHLERPPNIVHYFRPFVHWALLGRSSLICGTRRISISTRQPMAFRVLGFF